MMHRLFSMPVNAMRFYLLLLAGAATAVGMVWLACFLQPRAMRRYRAWQSRASTVAAAHGA